MIRDATIGDAKRIAELLSDLHAITSFSSLDFTVEKVESGVASFINSGQFVRVIDNGNIAGLFIGLIVPTWFGDDSIAVDIAWYVSPEKRGSISSIRLVKDFIKWAKYKGAKQFRPGVSTGDKLACDLYRKIGLKEIGAGFSIEL